MYVMGLAVHTNQAGYPCRSRLSFSLLVRHEQPRRSRRQSGLPRRAHSPEHTSPGRCGLSALVSDLVALAQIPTR
jgi:hypothetical protein